MVEIIFFFCAGTVPAEFLTLFQPFLEISGVAVSLCEKSTTQIFLDVELVHHFIDRKLVIQSSSSS
jgi:hypothetical protein